MHLNPIKTGVLGYGMSGKLFHVPFLTTNPKFTLKAVTERSKKEVHLHFPDVISYDSVEELIADDELELIVINTSNNTHFDFAKKAILAGKHVLIEKPMVPTKEEAEQLFDLGIQHNKHILVYQNRRWDSDFKMIREVIDGGKLGHLVEVHFRFDRYRSEIGPKAFKEKPFPGSGIGYDLGAHLVDQVIALFGKPKQTIKIGTKNREGTEVEDYVNFILSYENGLEVYVTTSYLVVDPGPGYVIHGTRGSFKKERTDVQEIQLLAGILPNDPEFGKDEPGGEGCLTYFDVDGEKQVELISPVKGNYAGLFDAVYAQIREGVSFPVERQQVMDQLAILQQPFWNK